MTNIYRIVVQVNGTEVSAIHTPERERIVSENFAYERQATAAADQGASDIPMIPGEPYRRFTAGWGEPLRLAAALYAIDPGHTQLVEAPAEVWAAIDQSPDLNTVTLSNTID